MRTTRLTSALAAASLLVLAAGCGGSDDSAATADDSAPAASADGLTVVATEFAFDPADLSIAADEDVELTLENAGVVEHDITVDELDLEIYADASETVTETVNVPAGTYEFYCSIPGHRTSGMEGTLTVD
jgi:plastocyanin